MDKLLMPKVLIHLLGLICCSASLSVIFVFIYLFSAIYPLFKLFLLTNQKILFFGSSHVSFFISSMVLVSIFNLKLKTTPLSLFISIAISASLISLANVFLFVMLTINTQ